MGSSKAYAATYNREYRQRNPTYLAEWRKRNPTKGREYKLKKYALTIEQWDAMLTAQNNNCALCFQPLQDHPKHPVGYVDHNHQTGEIRGILHPRCNMIVGVMENNPGLLDQVIAYLAGEKG